LDVHRIAHEIGLNTNATILYGHIESIEDRVHHMDLLRKAQDEALSAWADAVGIAKGSNGEVVLTGEATGSPSGARLPDPDAVQGYFQTIIPLPFIPDHS